MAIKRVELKRVFLMEDDEIELTDPDPTMTPEEVLSHYSGHYAELTTATCSAPKIEGDKIIFKIKDGVGTKG